MDSITFPQALEMFEYLNDNPPTHELVAAYLGFDKKKQAPLHFIDGKQVRPTENQDSISNLVRTPGVGSGSLPPTLLADGPMRDLYLRMKKGK